jgi:HlyD family secretion protein
MSEKNGFFRRHKRSLIFLAVIAVIAVIVVANLRSQREKTIRVAIEKAAKRDLTAMVSASGEVRPKKNVNISALVPGRIIKIGVVEGQEVNAGDFLLQLDSTQYEARAERDRNIIQTYKTDLIQAEARLSRDRNVYERQKKLYDEGLISKDQLEGAKAQYDVSQATFNFYQFQIKQAEASLKSTMDDLNKTAYTSPIDGIITSLKVEEGEVAIVGTMNNPGTVLMTIADLSVMEVEVKVDETDVIGVKLGQKARIRVDAFPDTTFDGTVTEIGSSALAKATGASQESRDFKVVITLDKPPFKLKPGLSASADIITAEKKAVLAVPISSLVIREKTDAGEAAAGKKEEEGVYIVESGRVKFQPVEKGIMGGMYIEITSGLKEGQEFVSGPYASLRELKDGVLVRAETKKEAPKK